MKEGAGSEIEESDKSKKESHRSQKEGEVGGKHREKRDGDCQDGDMDGDSQDGDMDTDRKI